MRRVDAVPPQAYFVGSAVFHYLGPSFAVLLFARVDVLGVAWLRIASAAAIFALWRRPWRTFLALDRARPDADRRAGRGLRRDERLLLHLDRPAPAGDRRGDRVHRPDRARGDRRADGPQRRRGRSAAAGVYLLTHVQFEGEPVGVAFAFANAALFTAYIVLAHRVARRSGLSGIDGLAAAMVLAFLFVSPIGLSSAATPSRTRWRSRPAWRSA